MAEVNIDGIVKAFGDVKVIHGVDCRIADGEFIVILGPSGCGKSTLLRIVAGLETQTGGNVEIGGKVVNDIEPKDRNIAMVFQNYALYPHMSVYDNMAYGLRVRGMAKAEIDVRVRKAAGILNLLELLDRKPRQLSGGQRQRVAMGRAIVREPAVFLFDEPLSNLDAKLRVQMRIEIKRLHQTIKTTSIYVTHDQVEAMTLADRLIVMNAGRAEQIGTPMEIYARPATVYVAGFIGSPAMNMLPAKRTTDGKAIELPGGAKLNLAQPLPGSGDILIGIRPEHVSIAAAGGGVFQMNVDLVEALGADTLVHGRIGGDVSLTIRLPGTTRVTAGQRLALAVEPNDFHLYDSSTSQRLN
jgi:sn-glycerol 3-phosphate transport system ATP-binding protein